MEEIKSNKIETMNNYVVTKSNKLITANYKLSAVEQKIVLFLVSKIRKDDEDFKTYTLSIKEFCELLGYTGTPKYTELRKITKKMFGKVLEIWDNGKLKQMSWVSYVEYNPKEGSVNISFDPRLKPYLLQLKREYTSYKLKNVMQLKSSYSIRLYEILKQWQTVKKTEIPLEILRKALGVENKYGEYHNFKKRVLNTAKKEINANTDISFDYEEIKKGRMVTSLCFYIETKSISRLSDDLDLENQDQEVPAPTPTLIETNIKDSKDDQQTPEKEQKLDISYSDIEIDKEWFMPLYDEIDALFKKHNIEGFNEEKLKMWIREAKHIKKPENYVTIREIVRYTVELKGIKNHIGLIVSLIRKSKDHIDNTNNVKTSKRKVRKELIPSWYEEHVKEVEKAVSSKK